MARMYTRMSNNVWSQDRKSPFPRTYTLFVS